MNLLKLNNTWFYDGDFLNYEEKDKTLKIFLQSLSDSYIKYGFVPVLSLINEEKQNLISFGGLDIDPFRHGKLSLLIEKYLKTIEKYEEQIKNQYLLYLKTMRFCLLFDDSQESKTNKQAFLIYDKFSKTIKEHTLKITDTYVEVSKKHKEYLFDEIFLISKFPYSYKRYKSCYYAESSIYINPESPIWQENLCTFLKNEEQNKL